MKFDELNSFFSEQLKLQECLGDAARYHCPQNILKEVAASNAISFIKKAKSQIQLVQLIIKKIDEHDWDYLNDIETYRNVYCSQIGDLAILLVCEVYLSSGIKELKTLPEGLFVDAEEMIEKFPYKDSPIASLNRIQNVDSTDDLTKNKEEPTLDIRTRRSKRIIHPPNFFNISPVQSKKKNIAVAKVKVEKHEEDEDLITVAQRKQRIKAQIKRENIKARDHANVKRGEELGIINARLISEIGLLREQLGKIKAQIYLSGIDAKIV